MLKALHFKIILVVFLGCSLPGIQKSASAQKPKIAVFGSSVAKGSGDTTTQGGYAGLLKKRMESQNWEVVNISRGGDNTSKIISRFEKDLLPAKPDIVIIGLSLGNEGIASGSSLTRNRVFERFRSGIVHLITLCRDNGMQPVVVNCYTRNDFGYAQYDAIQRMNLFLNSLDVPGINALGAIDDGTGKWADGYWHDKSHPNEKGHREIWFTVVPTLFDAIRAGKKCPFKVRSNRYLEISDESSSSPLSFVPDDTIHSFTISFMVKSTDNGTIAAVHGENQDLSIATNNGRIVCRFNNKDIAASDTTSENKGWQYVVVSHRYATENTAFYVNGKLAGTHTGRVHFKGFTLGGSGKAALSAPGKAGYKELLIYRSGLNAGEIEALYYDQLLPSSLEVYAPLNDQDFREGNSAENHAQSLSKLKINGRKLLSATEEEQKK
jgi:lysophospholipase L1-like esterase